jgi:uracil-DNA glycosylase
MSRINPHMHNSWKEILMEEFDKPYFHQLNSFLLSEKAEGKVVFPPGPDIFNAFNFTPFPKVKVVIIGQDPYHKMGQANGLSFSVAGGTKPPPSLMNIFKELRNDLGINVPPHGNLEKWAQQGVFMLNATLTVRQGEAASHHGKGWEQFTDVVIQKISQQREKIAFLLWGNFAQSKAVFIDEQKHLVLKAAHPSPLARGAFFGSRHFSKTNTFLAQNGFSMINWDINN